MFSTPGVLFNICWRIQSNPTFRLLGVSPQVVRFHRASCFLPPVNLSAPGSVPGTDTRRRSEPCIAETLCRRSGSYQVVSCCAWFVSAPPALLVRSQAREKVQYFLMRDEKHERHAVWLLKPVHACLDLCLSEYAQIRATVVRRRDVRLYVTHARKFFMLTTTVGLK